MSNGEKKALAKSLARMRDGILAARHLPKDKHGLRLWPGCRVRYGDCLWLVASIDSSKRLHLVRHDGYARIDTESTGGYVERLEK